MVQPEIVTLPAWLAALLFGALTAAGYLLHRRLKPPARLTAGYEPDWSVPPIDDYASAASFFHQWDPRLKIVALLGFCLLAASLKSLSLAVFAMSAAAAGLRLSRLPFSLAARRLRAMSGFLAMLLIVLPFSAAEPAGGTWVVLAGWPGLTFSGHGLLLALTIVVKACTIALLVDPLFATAPLPVTLEGFRRLGVPPSICQMVFLSYRYIFVFAEEMNRMYTSMLVRGYQPRCNMATLRTMGNFFGMLFVSSYDRNQQVYEAMLCRGYDGTLPTFVTLRATSGDWLKGLLWLLPGVALLLGDLYLRSPLGG